MDKEKIGKTIFWLAIAAVIGGFLVWAYLQLSKPLPGEAVADMGREHVPAGTAVEYNSNPPTSGPHYADWTRPGIYDEPVEDGYLIHSLEHGYVIISYRDKGLKEELTALAEDLGLNKLIVISRPTLDGPLALTAWGRILKLETLDLEKINEFASVFHNAGPEQTVE